MSRIVVLVAAAACALAVAKATGKAAFYRGATRVGGKHYLGGWIFVPGGQQRGAVAGPDGVVAAPQAQPGPASAENP